MDLLARSREANEKRETPRKSANIEADITALDGEDNCRFKGLVIDINESGATLFTNIPLPVSTIIEINMQGNVRAIGEVIDWQWDYNRNLARLGMKYLKK